MKKTDENNAGKTFKNTAAKNRTFAGKSNRSQFGRRNPAPEGRPMLQQGPYQPVAGKDSISPRHAINSQKGEAMVAARGDDDLMSQQQNVRKSQAQQQQQPQSMPSGDVMKAKWKQQVGAAKVVWGKLTEDELLKSEGHAQKLTGLVQERYAVSLEEADKQVKRFIEANKM